MLCRGRMGGLATQLTFASIHAGTHVIAAIFSVILLELGVETCIRYRLTFSFVSLLASYSLLYLLSVAITAPQMASVIFFETHNNELSVQEY